MINLTGTTLAVKILLPDTTIGTCNYSAVYFPVSGEILHNVESITGVKLQWVTPSISLETAQNDAIAKIAELRPAATPNPDLPAPEGMSDTDKLAW